MTFDEFWKTREHYKNMDGKAWCRAGWNGAVDNIQALPQRAMFDEGIVVGKTMAAKEIITLIMEWEGSWSVLDFKDAIKEKFGLEI